MVLIISLVRMSITIRSLRACDYMKALVNRRVQRLMTGQILVFSLWLSLHERVRKSNIKYILMAISLTLILSYNPTMTLSLSISVSQSLLLMQMQEPYVINVDKQYCNH